jgi:hypothetical protein
MPPTNDKKYRGIEDNCWLAAGVNSGDEENVPGHCDTEQFDRCERIRSLQAYEI